MFRASILPAAVAAFFVVPLTLPAQQQAAFTLCRDGTKTTATGNVACANHGGIAVPAHDSGGPPKSTVTITSSKPEPAPHDPNAAPPSAPAKADSTGPDLAGAVARCKDHTYSKTRTPKYTCVGHGGVATWLRPQN
jgi:Protein of unknown function (DUF3761)